MDERMNRIKQLQETVRELSGSSENKRRAALWEDSAISNDYWHGIPKTNKPLFTVEFERATYANILGFSMIDFYQDPLVMIEAQLQMMVFKFTEIQDCTPIGRSFAYYPGAGFEKSLFGGPSVYTAEDAWMAREDLITSQVDISSLEPLDFFKSGSMPQIHEFYQKAAEAVDDDFTVAFPQWSRSPWGVAWHIRGIDNLLVDLMDDEQWAADFLNYITETRIRWTRDRAEFLGIPLSPCNIYNDEVTSPMISPATYRDLIRPTEIRLSEAFGGVNYWHSCGDTTPFVEYINGIPNVHMVTVSAWTDLARAERYYDKARVTLEKQLHPYDDILGNPDPDRFQARLEEIITGFNGSKGIVRAEGLQILRDFKQEIGKVKKWCDCANERMV